MSRHWPRVRLGEVLRRSEEMAVLQADAEYSEITVRLWGKGVVERGRVLGAEIASNRRFIAREGQFIASRIDARNGAMGIVPAYLDGAVVTNDFPLFNIDAVRLLPAYFRWLSGTQGFVELCLLASEGTTNRVRLKEDRFLALEIPLPPLAEQRRIVARIEELAAQIHEARALRQQALTEVDALLGSARNALIGVSPDSSWVPLNRFVQEIENGKSPQCESRPASNGEWGVLKVGAVSFGIFDEQENKALPAAMRVDPRYEVRQGDFLMSRANTMELVGACAIVPNTRPKLLLSDKTFRFHFRDGIMIDPRWLDHTMKAPVLREQISRAASGTSPTMKNISKEKVLGLLLPPHEQQEQRRIVAELDALQAEVDTLKRHQADTAAELDALLPAILDRAFKGEL